MTLELGVGLQEAAQRIHPVRPDYQSIPIEQGFDWPVIAGQDFDQLYLVVFRSERLPDADLDLLRWFADLAYAAPPPTGPPARRGGSPPAPPPAAAPPAARPRASRAARTTAAAASRSACGRAARPR